LGYHQSRWGYKSAQDIREVAESFKENDLPISAIHLDIHYMDDYRVFTVNSKAFPDMKGLADDLAAEDICLVSIIDPGVKEDKNYALYTQGIENRFFLTEPKGKPYVGLVWPGRALFPDFTNPSVRAWWGDQYEWLINQGIRGFWHDMNEPTSFVAWGDNRLPLVLEHHLDGQGGDHKQSHNIYGHTMAEAGFQGQKKHNPDQRPWLLSRSAWVGSQRYTWSWTGDVESTWDSLRMCIPMIINLSLSGQPFSGPDIGGFSGSPSAELYLRWLELATFLPFFRTHSALTTDRREPWVFGEEATQIVRKYLKLRYELMPYFYALAWQASRNGTPLVRPMFWPDRPEEYLWEINDQFLLGDTLLIAPIVQEGAHSREIILPPGNWYNFWSGEPGTSRVEVQAGLDSIPIYCKEGSILPRETAPGILTIDIFAFEHPHEKELVYQLYSDSGDGVIIYEHEYRLDTFYLTQGQNHLTLHRESEGGYELPYKSIRIRVFGWEPAELKVDGRDHGKGDWFVPVNFTEICLSKLII
jgi:alpha-glucosidase